MHNLDFGKGETEALNPNELNVKELLTEKNVKIQDNFNLISKIIQNKIEIVKDLSNGFIKK